MGLRFPEKQHQGRGQDDHAALYIVADVHDLRLVETVPQHPAHRRENQQGSAAQRQIKALQEGVVAADLQDIETHGKVIKKRAEFGYQRAQENEAEVPVEKNIVSR